MTEEVLYQLFEDDIKEIMNEQGIEISSTSYQKALENVLFWIGHNLKTELGYYLDYERDDIEDKDRN